MNVKVTSCLCCSLAILFCACRGERNFTHECGAFRLRDDEPTDEVLVAMFAKHTNDYRTIITTVLATPLSSLGEDWESPRSAMLPAEITSLRRQMQQAHVKSITKLSDGAVKLTIYAQGYFSKGGLKGFLFSTNAVETKDVETSRVSRGDHRSAAYRVIAPSWFIFRNP
jgi:hypothetical protein